MCSSRHVTFGRGGCRSRSLEHTCLTWPSRSLAICRRMIDTAHIRLRETKKKYIFALIWVNACTRRIRDGQGTHGITKGDYFRRTHLLKSLPSGIIRRQRRPTSKPTNITADPGLQLFGFSRAFVSEEQWTHSPVSLSPKE